MAAPICWSANGESRTPASGRIPEYHERRGQDAQRHRQNDHHPVGHKIAQIPPSVESFGFIGCEGMSCSQNRTPVTKNDGVHQPDVDSLISFGEIEESAGTCQMTIAALKARQRRAHPTGSGRAPGAALPR